MSRDTKVSKTSPAIRKILNATVGPKWTGTNIVVRELPASWRYTGTRHDVRCRAWLLNLGTMRVHEHPPSAPSSLPYMVELLAPHDDEAIVRVMKMGKMDVEIIISEDAIDSSAVAVATDALLSHDKMAAQQAAGSCGGMSGLCMALAEANAKALAKGERVGDLTATLTSTSQTPSAKRAKGNAARLDREIAAALSRR